MKLLIATGLYPPEIGGPATYAKLFEEQLPRHGIEVSVLPFRIVRPLPPIIRHIVYAAKVAWLAREVDLILVQDTVSTGFPAAIASMLLRKPFVLRVPGDYAWEQGVQRFGVKEDLDEFQKHSYGPAVSILRAIQRFVVRRACRVIAPSQYLSRTVSGWISSKKVDVIYNGVEISSEAHRAPQENLIISSGRLVSWKGFSELIDIVTKHRPWRLVIFGSGPQKKMLTDEIQKADAADRIEVREQVPHEELQRRFAAASVFVLNSRYEGLSHTLVEAMVVGMPVIATNVGGNPEVIQDGVNGILVNVGDKDALEKALVSLMSDAKLRERLGAAAAERAKDFSIDKTIEATALLLKSCVPLEAAGD